MNNKRITVSRFFTFVSLGIMVIFCAVFIFNRKAINIAAIKKITPHQMILGSIVLLFLFALKSLAVVFPVVLLLAAGGYIYGFKYGLVIGILGIVVTSCVPYLIGRIAYNGGTKEILDKHPKVKSILSCESHEILGNNIFLRSLAFMPYDVISLYMGAVKADFLKYILGSVIGFSPYIIIMAYAGSKISDPSSPQFIGSLIAEGVVTVISIVIYIIVRKKARTN